MAALTLMVSSALSGQRLPIKSFSASDGLPGGGINRIVRDSHGFLWFCSTEGIARFDGHDFVRFGADAGWPAHAVNDFLQARDGSCWIATSQGLFRLDMAVPGGPPTGGGRRVVPVSSRNLSVTCLFEDRTGVLWCGTHAGLFRVDRSPGPGSLRSINLGFPEKTTDDPIVTALAGKDGGGLWIGAGSGLYSLEPDGRVGRYTKADGLPDTWVRSLAVAGDGSFWVATRKGVGRLRLSAGASRLEVLETYTRGNGFPDLVSDVLLRTGEGKIIVGTGVGLSLIERAKVDSYGLDEGLEVPVLALAEGARGELWVGTDHGAQRWILDGLTTYVPSDRPFQRINSLLEDRTGALVAVTANDTLFKIRRMVGNRLLSSTLRMPPGSHRPGWGWHQPLLQDHLGAWWCATDQGLCRFEVTPSAAALPGARHARTYKVQQISGSGSDEVFAVFEDSRGDIWFSTVANPLNGLGRWVRAGDRIEGFNGKAGIPERPSLATAFAEDQAGNVWVAFNGAGLGRFRNGRFDLFTEADGIPACWIRSMMLDGSGRLWVACSRGGVRIIEDPTAAVPHVRAFTTDQGLAGNSIWSCVEDRWGRVYVGTGAGIDRVDLEHGRVLHLSEAQGLASGVPRAAIRDREGTLWFGLSGGLSRYVPPAPKPEQPPPIFLISLRVAGTARALPESGAPEWDLPDLPAGQNRIEVDFTSPGGLGGNTLRYQYRLRGVSDDWSRASLDRRVDLANLAPGHYHFQVRAMGEEGRTSDPPAEFRFTILPPLWIRWWFLTVAAGSLLGVAWLGYNYRLRHLLEVERIRTRIAADLHDDIGASLSRIAILSEVVKRRTPEDQPETARFLSEIAESSRDLVDSMAEIVWSINPKRDDLQHLLARIGQFASASLQAKDIRWTMTLPPDPAKVKLTPEQRRGMYLILKEAINNALKHSGCRSMNLQVALGQGRLTAQIRDDGSGLPPEPPGSESTGSQRGRGLINMQVRAHDIGGHLDVASGPEGTTIRLDLPFRGGA
ncbi:sensor histidine kinase [Geothrix sp.]|uniref:sensor histidine kinase n=1 Tax=Geothrix sp. TaxID=1962974 RepID=UPI00261E2974|nr:sensor histidine kinase [Geothrix sp.]WIL20006.1 MAG: histidine kinase [Geothrix sp.]